MNCLEIYKFCVAQALKYHMVNWMAKKYSLHCTSQLSRVNWVLIPFPESSVQQQTVVSEPAGKHSEVAGQRQECESACPGHQVAALPSIWLPSGLCWLQTSGLHTIWFPSVLCWHQVAALPTIWLPSGLFWRAVERKGLNSPKRNSRLCALELLAIKRTVCSYLKHSYIYDLFKENLCPEKRWRVQDLGFIFKYFILKEGKQINELYRCLLAEPESSQASWPLVPKADSMAHE